MKPEDLKNSINFVEPDDYMQTRLFAEISSADKPKKKNRKMFKAAISAVLCCAVLMVGLGFGIPKNNNKVNEDVDIYSSDGNIFVLNVYAAENKEGVSVTDHTVTIPEWKFVKEFDENGELDSIHGHSENACISISGENIKYVRYTCETAYLDVSDYDYRDYLIENNEYYDFIVPYSEEYQLAGTIAVRDLMYSRIENGYYDEFADKSKLKPYEEYFHVDIIYDENENPIGVGLLSCENYNKCFATCVYLDGTPVREYTFQNYYNKTENIGSVKWVPDLDLILEKPKTSFSKIPHDIITIEVTFNDGMVKTQQYDFSLNDNGELVIDIV